jgi:hypothetical protein
LEEEEIIDVKHTQEDMYSDRPAGTGECQQSDGKWRRDKKA